MTIQSANNLKKASYQIDDDVVDSVVLKALLVSRGVKVSRNVYKKYQAIARLSPDPLTCNSFALPDGTVVQLTDLSFHMEYMKSMVNWDMFSQLKYLPQLKTDFSINLDQDEQPALYYKNKFVSSVSFFPHTAFYSQKTTSGLPFLGNAVLQGKDWLSFQLLWKCDYALEGEPCQYCFSGGELASLAKRKKKLPRYPTPEDVAEICEYALIKEKCANSIQITGGSSFDNKAEIRKVVDILNAIDHKLGKENIPGEIVAYITPPKVKEDVDAMFSAGADRVSCSLEIWDESLANQIMPGKMKFTGRQRHLDCLLYIAEKYGKNKACCNFIIGLEPLESLFEGVEFMASRGIIPIASVWIPFGRPVLGSMKAKEAAYYQAVEKEMARAYQKYGIVPPGKQGLNVCFCRDIYNKNVNLG
jgi:hypothetical protein